MTWFAHMCSRLSSLWGGRPERGSATPVAGTGEPEGMFVFANTGEVIQAESILRSGGFAVRVMGPPPALRTGCDMVVVFPLMHAFAASTLLEQKGLPPLRSVPAGETLLSPVSLFVVKDFGPWLMVRAANMKITAEKATRRIVNLSGGGCPDAPWLAALMTGRLVDEGALLREQGKTLCGYALHLALEELKRILDGGGGR